MFTKILVPLDCSPLAEQALGPALLAVRAANASLDLVLVHQPFPITGLDTDGVDAEILRTEDTYLESIVTEATSESGVTVTHAVLQGDPVEMIRARALDVGADLIVMTTHGRTGLSRAWLGSVADGVMRHLSVPVLMLRPFQTATAFKAAHHLYQRILVPLDQSDASQDILASALALAQCGSGQLVLLHVVETAPLFNASAVTPFGFPEVGIPASNSFLVDLETSLRRQRESATDNLNAVVKRLKREGINNVQAHVVVAEQVAQGITDFAKASSIDAIAMSTHGRGTSRLIVGSIADKVLRSTNLPVLLRRPAHPADSRMQAQKNAENALAVT